MLITTSAAGERQDHEQYHHRTTPVVPQFDPIATTHEERPTPAPPDHHTAAMVLASALAFHQDQDDSEKTGRDSSVSSPALLSLTSSFGSSSPFMMSDQSTRSSSSNTTTAANEDKEETIETPTMTTTTATLPSTTTTTSSSSSRTTKPFPITLHEMLDAAEQEGFAHLLCWSSDGQSFRIHHPHTGAAAEAAADSEAGRATEELLVILGKYFRLTKYKSFLRQIQTYGFQRRTYRTSSSTSQTTDTHKGSVLFHPQFKRGQQALCVSMKRKEAKRRILQQQQRALQKEQQQQQQQQQNAQHTNAVRQPSDKYSPNNSLPNAASTVTMDTSISRSISHEDEQEEHATAVATAVAVAPSDSDSRMMTMPEETISPSMFQDPYEPEGVGMENYSTFAANGTVSPMMLQGQEGEEEDYQYKNELGTTGLLPQPTHTNLSLSPNNLAVSRSISMDTLHEHYTNTASTTTTNLVTRYQEEEDEEARGSSDEALITRQCEFIANAMILPLSDCSQDSSPTVMESVLDNTNDSTAAATARLTPPTEDIPSTYPPGTDTKRNTAHTTVLTDPYSRSLLTQKFRPLLSAPRSYGSHVGNISPKNSRGNNTSPCCPPYNGAVTTTTAIHNGGGDGYYYYSKNGVNMRSAVGGTVPEGSSLIPPKAKTKNNNTDYPDSNHELLPSGSNAQVAVASGYTLRLDNPQVFLPSATSSFTPVVAANQYTYGRNDGDDDGRTTVLTGVASLSEVPSSDTIDQGIMEAFIDDNTYHHHHELNRNDDNYHQRFLHYALGLLVDE